VEIVVPEGALVVLIGVAGAGKSTFAARHFRPHEILSSDAFRGIVGNSESDQAATRPAFAALHRALLPRLSSHRTTVVDATNVTGWARRGLLARAASAGSLAIAVVFDLPAALCLARNAARAEAGGTQPVPGRAIQQQSRDLRRSLRDPAGLSLEGFHEVYRLASPAAVDAVRLVRPRQADEVPGLLPLAAATEREDPTEP
jgi:protein phosphatase